MDFKTPEGMCLGDNSFFNVRKQVSFINEYCKT